MEFKDYASGLQPYISENMTGANYFVAIIGNFLKDSAMDSCALLNYQNDTQYRYLKGNKIRRTDAQYVYDYRDRDKYVVWIKQQIDSSDSHEEVATWLTENGKTGEYIENECQELLEEIILSLCKNTQKKTPSLFEGNLTLLTELNTLIEQLPKPSVVGVPDDISNVERPYINQLFAAYGDAESCPDFLEENLENYPEYKEDFDDRRMEYYSAASIERSVAELNIKNTPNQFDVLKEEILDNVKDTARKIHQNGYQKMLTVMEKATSSPVESYLLGKSPFWINGKIKKGVCHYLVNDGKLMWVKKI